MNILLLTVILLGTATFCLDTLPNLDPDSQEAQVREEEGVASSIWLSFWQSFGQIC
jgi:hypothetical protein